MLTTRRKTKKNALPFRCWNIKTNIKIKKCTLCSLVQLWCFTVLVEHTEATLSNVCTTLFKIPSGRCPAQSDRFLAYHIYFLDKNQTNKNHIYGNVWTGNWSYIRKGKWPNAKKTHRRQGAKSTCFSSYWPLFWNDRESYCCCKSILHVGCFRLSCSQGCPKWQPT